jgi:hypothetical protein
MLGGSENMHSQLVGVRIVHGDELTPLSISVAMKAKLREAIKLRDYQAGALLATWAKALANSGHRFPDSISVNSLASSQAPPFK